jgi:CDP-diacylglycerol--glycerol-3-phosphate 3-phosphatidyltransferase
MFSTFANTLSVIRIVLSPVFLLLIIVDNSLLRQISLAVFLVAALTDWYDGVIARRSGTVTNLGKFLDPLADKFLTSSAFIAFALLHYVYWWMVIVIVFRDLLITVLRSFAETRGAHIVTSKAAQWKTFIQMIVLYYLLLLIVGQDVRWVEESFGDTIRVLLDADVVFKLMLAVTLLTIYTGVQYIVENWGFVKSLLFGGKRTTE